ncbi:MAG: hypothetical protein FJX61_02765 [Alphaproteobacteria bacterium]|nr:hypothetical protein [Alphaproteobacteria bacterium]
MASPPAIKREEDLQEEWLTTYADAITLLMCFFVLMYSISEPSQEKFEEVAGGLTEGFSGKLVPQNQPFLNLIQQAQQTNPNEGGEKGKTATTQRGVTFDFKAASILKVGSAEIVPEGIPSLDRVAQLVSFMGIGTYSIDVEGHTDDSPPSGSGTYATNWELSAARATNVVKFLISRGVDPQRLRAIGYADTKPKAPNRDTAGKPIPQNQAENRRIVIRVER